MNWAILGEFLGPNSPQIWSDFAETCTRGSVQEDTNNFSKILEKFKFLQTGDTQSFYVWSHFDPFFPSEDGRNRKKLKH